MQLNPRGLTSLDFHLEMSKSFPELVKCPLLQGYEKGKAILEKPKNIITLNTHVPYCGCRTEEVTRPSAMIDDVGNAAWIFFAGARLILTG
jgi:hypothetical protein